MDSPFRQEFPTRAEAGRTEEWFMEVAADNMDAAVAQDEQSVDGAEQEVAEQSTPGSSTG